MDQLVKDGYCFAKEDVVYAIYLPEDSERSIKLKGGEGSYSVGWFDPRNGGDLQKGSVETVTAGRNVELGNPPSEPGKDWVCLLRKQN